MQFPYEIFTVIARYSDFRTSYNISEALLDKKHDLTKYCDLSLNFNDKICKELLNIGFTRPKEFIKALTTTSSYISGSFVLSVLLNENWKSGDIDVPSALTITLFYMTFSWLGAIYNKKIDELYVYGSFAVSVFLTSAYFFWEFIKALRNSKK